MAVTVTVRPSNTNALIFVDVYGHEHSTSTLLLARRVPPTSRELPSIAFVPEDERYRQVWIVLDAPVRDGGTRLIDWHARATVPYQYAARERFADGVVQPFSAWTE